MRVVSLFFLAHFSCCSLGFAPLSGNAAVRRHVARSAEIENTATTTKFDQLQPRTNPSFLEFPDRDYFYGRVNIELGEGYKTMTEDYAPSWKDDQCSLAVVEASLPLGMVIEESDNCPGKFEIGEVYEGSNAEKAGVKAGDMLRGVTAQKKVNRMRRKEDYYHRLDSTDDSQRPISSSIDRSIDRWFCLP